MYTQRPKKMTQTEREVQFMSDEALKAEYELINKKESDLSSMKRRLVIERYEAMQSAEEVVNETSKEAE